MVKRKKLIFNQLLKNNREEILKDKDRLERIEKRLEEKAEMLKKMK